MRVCETWTHNKSRERRGKKNISEAKRITNEGIKPNLVLQESEGSRMLREQEEVVKRRKEGKRKRDRGDVIGVSSERGSQ